MAQITIEIPNNIQQRVVDGLAESHGYDSKRHGNKGAYAKKVVIDFIRNTVKSHESRKAGEQAAKQANERAESEVDLS